MLALTLTLTLTLTRLGELARSSPPPLMLPVPASVREEDRKAREAADRVKAEVEAARKGLAERGVNLAEVPEALTLTRAAGPRRRRRTRRCTRASSSGATPRRRAWAWLRARSSPTTWA